MHIVQIFIPLFDQGGEQFDERLFTGLKEKLTGYFGGVTIYQRAPAYGKKAVKRYMIRLLSLK
jgi:hypothetical protein